MAITVKRNTPLLSTWAFIFMAHWFSYESHDWANKTQQRRWVFITLQAIYEGSEEYASTRKVSSRSSAANLCHPPPRELPGAILLTKLNNPYNHAHLPAPVKFPLPLAVELTLKLPPKSATAPLVTVMFHMVWNLTRMVQGRLSSLLQALVATLTLEIVAATM